MEEAGERFDAFLCLFDLHMHDLKNTMRPIGEMGECLWTLQNTETLDPVIISLISPFYTLAQGRLGLGQHLRIIHAILHGDLASAERALIEHLRSAEDFISSMVSQLR